jgi:S-adenosylmethionine decarboxylase
MWGFHLLLDLGKCNIKSIKCPNNIIAFNKHLVKAIDMVPYGEPQLAHFGEGDKAGYTSVQLIMTSSIVCHFCEENGSVYMDLHSCKPYNKDTVKNIAGQYFEPESIKEHYVERLA